MKIFMVFSALFILNMCIISYQGDMARYVQLRGLLEEAAHECAEYAALECVADDVSLAEDFADGLVRHIMGRFSSVRTKGHSCEFALGDGFATALIRMDVEGLFSFLCPSGVGISAAGRCTVAEIEEAGEDESI